MDLSSPNWNKFYSQALDSAMDGILIADTDLNILYANHSATLFLGCSRGITGYQDWDKLFDVYFEETREKVPFSELPACKVLRGEAVEDYRLFITSQKYPEGISISCNGTAVLDDGNKLGVILTFRDISEVLKKEALLREQKSFLQDVLDVIPASIFIRDSRGNTEFRNKYFIESLRPSLPNVEELSKSAQEVTQRVSMPDGEERVFHTFYFTLKKSSGEITHSGGISFDETAKEKSKEILELERMKAISAAKMATIGNLAAEIGHEINNPLCVIKSITYLLKDFIKQDMAGLEFIVERLNAIDETVERMRSIIKSLKNLSHKGEMNHKSVCRLHEILDDVVSVSEMKFRKLSIDLVKDFKEEALKRRINCYPVQLSEVLLNLLINAADSVEGMENGWVKISLFEDEQYICIEVSDSGPGVPENLQDKIFEPFFTTKPIGKGTGLGLSISKNFMKEHGGDLFLAAKRCFSCFMVKIPKNS